jgi:hypothetical protein
MFSAFGTNSRSWNVRRKAMRSSCDPWILAVGRSPGYDRPDLPEITSPPWNFLPSRVVRRMSSCLIVQGDIRRVYRPCS